MQILQSDTQLIPALRVLRVQFGDLLKRRDGRGGIPMLAVQARQQEMRPGAAISPSPRLARHRARFPHTSSSPIELLPAALTLVSTAYADARVPLLALALVSRIHADPGVAGDGIQAAT